MREFSLKLLPFSSGGNFINSEIERNLIAFSPKSCLISGIFPVLKLATTILFGSFNFFFI